MKSQLIVATLFAACVSAKPFQHLHLHKRDYVTHYVTVLTTLTEGGDFPAPTGSSDDNHGWGGWGSWSGSWGGWGGWHGTHSDAAPATTTTTFVSESAPTPEFTPPTQTPSPPTTPSTPSFPETTVSESQPAATSSGPSDVSSYAQAILDQHNNHRANATVPPVTWSDQLANIAQQIASSCVYAHNTKVGGIPYGQNIGAGSLPADVPALITNAMYDNEIENYPLPYGQANPDMSGFEGWGHYSQIVWKSTTQIGCYTQYCPNGLANTGGGVQPYFTVCNYGPPGNVGGEYGDNVLPPSEGLPSVSL